LAQIIEEILLWPLTIGNRTLKNAPAIAALLVTDGLDWTSDQRKKGVDWANAELRRIGVRGKIGAHRPTDAAKRQPLGNLFATVSSTKFIVWTNFPNCLFGSERSGRQMSSRSADTIVGPFGQMPITKANRFNMGFEIGSRRSAFELPFILIRSALEMAAVEFINENGGVPGMRLRKRRRAKPSKSPFEKAF
jgi:hypothetical protein